MRVSACALAGTPFSTLDAVWTIYGRSMNCPAAGEPPDPDAASAQARALEHILRVHDVTGPKKVADLLAELGGADDVQAALEQLAYQGLLEVLPDERIQPTDAALRFWRLVPYLK